MDNLLERVKEIDLRMVLEDLGFRMVQNRRMKCPFHEENSPSMVIYPLPQNEFHCFGCGKHGDVINFYAEVNNLDFKTALEQLAFKYVPNYDKTGMRPIRNKTNHILYKPKEPEKSYIYTEKHSQIYEALREFCLNYKTTQSAIDAATYLNNRGLENWLIKHFKIFMIKNYAATNDFLKSKYSVEDLKAAGLVNDKGNLVFYVHPIIFPYFENGRIVYLQGRTIGSPKDGASKYQFLKGVPRPIFNKDILKQLPTNAKLYITEGAIDCMTLVQQGFPAISLGSAKHFKPEWAKLFVKFRVFIWFDNDFAGQQGTLELMEMLHLNGISVEREYIPDGFKDINEYFTKKR